MAKPPPKLKIKTVRDGLQYRYQLWVNGVPVKVGNNRYPTRLEARQVGKDLEGVK
jgi:hypothetical protein